MITPSIKMTRSWPTAAEYDKQIRFGTAVGLTATAKEGQKASVNSIKSSFTVRSNWFEQNMRPGIKITPATKQNMKAEVKTSADWLAKHEKGGTFSSGSGHRLAVPTASFRPRGSTKKIPASMKPRALLAAGKAFIMQTHRGEVLVMPQGKAHDRLKFLFGFERSVKIKKRSVFFEPIQDTVRKKLGGNIKAGIAKAFGTMRFK
jgi:hypothetical protein